MKKIRTVLSLCSLLGKSHSTRSVLVSIMFLMNIKDIDYSTEIGIYPNTNSNKRNITTFCIGYMCTV